MPDVFGTIVLQFIINTEASLSNQKSELQRLRQQHQQHGSYSNSNNAVVLNSCPFCRDEEDELYYEAKIKERVDSQWAVVQFERRDVDNFLETRGRRSRRQQNTKTRFIIPRYEEGLDDDLEVNYSHESNLFRNNNNATTKENQIGGFENQVILLLLSATIPKKIYSVNLF